MFPEILSPVIVAMTTMNEPGGSFIQEFPAYLDPGTGSLIIQVVIGVVVGGLATAKIFWKQITLFFKSFFSRNAKNSMDE